VDLGKVEEEEEKKNAIRSCDAAVDRDGRDESDGGRRLKRRGRKTARTTRRRRKSFRQRK
jgi:hypothetical protein